jgi:hypothetical protein
MSKILQGLGTLNQFLAGEVARTREEDKKKALNATVVQITNELEKRGAAASFQDLSDTYTDLIQIAAQSNQTQELLPTINNLMNLEREQATASAMKALAPTFGLPSDIPDILGPQVMQLATTRKGLQTKETADIGKTKYSIIYGPDNKEIERRPVGISEIGLEDYKQKGRLKLAQANAASKAATGGGIEYTDLWTAAGDPVVEDKTTKAKYKVVRGPDGKENYIALSASDKALTMAESISEGRAQLTQSKEAFNMAVFSKKQQSEILLRELADKGGLDLPAEAMDREGKFTINPGEILDAMMMPGKIESFQAAMEEYANEKDDEVLQTLRVGGKDIKVASSLKGPLQTALEATATQKFITGQLSPDIVDPLGNLAGLRPVEYNRGKRVIDNILSSAEGTNPDASAVIAAGSLRTFIARSLGQGVLPNQITAELWDSLPGGDKARADIIKLMIDAKILK